MEPRIKRSSGFTWVLFWRKLMLDLKRIRTDFEAVSAQLATRGVSKDTLEELKALDQKRRDL